MLELEPANRSFECYTQLIGGCGIGILGLKFDFFFVAERSRNWSNDARYDIVESAFRFYCGQTHTASPSEYEVTPRSCLDNDHTRHYITKTLASVYRTEQ
jgi:hypothetical protein